MYTQEMLESIKKVEATRGERLGADLRRMTAEEKDEVLRSFHPDYKEEGFTTLKVGANKGEKVPVELAEMLEGRSRILDKELDLNKIDYDVDVKMISISF